MSDIDSGAVAGARAFLLGIHKTLAFVEDDSEESIVDVRVQFVDGGFEFHSGDASYDTDHRGGWGYGAVSKYDNASDLAQLAYDLVAEALEDYAEHGAAEE